MKTAADSRVLAAYLRLSLEDGDKEQGDESNSIINQRKLIERYLLSHPDLAALEYTEFVDDGYSGTNTARPSFRNMIKQVKAGKIQCIIVKDMSRFSRNYLTLGDYVEQILPMHGVRFVSINDPYDSKEVDSYLQSMSAALQGIVYDYYSKDLSNKQQASIHYRMATGQFRIPSAPYGYKINRETHRLEIEPEAAVIVRMIFDQALKGDTLQGIAETLNNCHIPPPGIYARLHPELRLPCRNQPEKYPFWTSQKVARILKNNVYTGTLELGKTYRCKPRQVKIHIRPKEEWIVHENAHDAIVTKEEYRTASDRIFSQKIRKKRNPDQRSYPRKSALTGKLRCGHCGLVMTAWAKNMSVKCKNSFSTGIPNPCPNTEYSIAVLEDFVYYSLRAFLEQAILEEAAQEQTVRQARSELKNCQWQIVKRKQQKERLLQDSRLLFESFSDGTLSASDYSGKKEQLRVSRELLEKETEQWLETERSLLSATVDPAIRMTAQKAAEYLKEKSLTRDMVTDYVESVMIYGIDDYRIVWRYPEMFQHLQEQAQKNKASM